MDSYDGNCFMSVSNMEDFIRESTAHAALCAKQLVLVDHDLSIGAFMRQKWQCPCCGDMIVFDNCDFVKSEVCARGRKYSRSQPDLNIRLATGATLSGVNLTKLQELIFGHMAIKIAADKNICIAQTKVRAGVRIVFEQRKVENRTEHSTVTRAAPGYSGDIEFEMDGEKCSASSGDCAVDGAGATRHYNNKGRGRQSALIVNSRATSKPLALVVCNVSRLCSISLLRKHN